MQILADFLLLTAPVGFLFAAKTSKKTYQSDASSKSERFGREDKNTQH
jgi:hypothetical protein